MITRIPYKLLLLFALVYSSNLFSQQGNNWYFGYNAGITFNTNPPSALTNSAMYTNEGCASISDDYGNLLFYTDGITIYNRKHQVMMNGDGLLGNFSATQSALLVQQPGNDSLYYVFTSPAEILGAGYNYNIVNINRNGGDGEVILKNQFLFGIPTERITAGRAANGKDVWIVGKEFLSSKFVAYKLDCAGLNLNPVVSIVGDTIFNTAGYMKISGDGNYLAVAIAGTIEPFVNIYKFDNNTGLLSSPIHIPIKYATYGLEFSPDSKLLYATSYPDFQGIYQFSISTYDSAAIANSKLYFNIGKNVCGLQTGPDGKIYVARPSTKVIGVIENPNTYGSGYNFQDSVVLLTNECRAGFPNFLANQLVNQNTAIDYSVNPNCSTVSFIGSTSMKELVNWLWDFGDETTSSDQNPVHSFTGGGNQFTIKLTVTPVAGCGRSYTTKILHLVRPVLSAKFGILNTCGNTSVSFKDSSNISAGSITRWHWDFGDGGTSELQNPIHDFINTGAHNIKLAVEYNEGCVVNADTTRTFIIESNPVAGFNTSVACVNKNVGFMDAASIVTGSIVGWQWDFGDGSSSTEHIPTHLYASPGNYNVRQIVQSNTGCVDSIIKKIFIDDKPVVDFITGNSCVNIPVSFSDKSFVSNGSISKWDWVMGDGSTANIANPIHLYSNYGDYSVSLVVSTPQGCLSDTLMRSIKVDAIPIADFTILPGCVNTNLIIQNKSSIEFGSIGRYFWDWGNGMFSQQQQPSFAYPTFGNYTVKEVARSVNGCLSDTAYKIVSLETAPEVDFIFGNTCVGKPVLFSNLTINKSGAIVAWNWHFGQSEPSSSLFEPEYTYNEFGKFKVAVSASTANGCTSIKSKEIIIKKVSVFAGNDTTIAINQPLQLYAAGAQNYQWLPNQYMDNNSSDHPLAVLPQNYTYFLSGVTSEGCTGYDTVNIKVYKGPEIYVPNSFTPNGDRNNDVLKPISPGIKTLLYFSVYNRWGQLVFTTKETDRGWDGKYNGQDQPSGLFVWTLKAIFYNNTMTQTQGASLLIR